jgi:hypothetical protein
MNSETPRLTRRRETHSGSLKSYALAGPISVFITETSLVGNERWSDRENERWRERDTVTRLSFFPSLNLSI